jgi:hypothetical protein
LKVREGGAVKVHSLLFVFRAWPKIRRGSVVVGIVRGQEMVDEREIALVPHFLNKSAKDSLGFF